MTFHAERQGDMSVEAPAPPALCASKLSCGPGRARFARVLAMPFLREFGYGEVLAKLCTKRATPSSNRTRGT